MPKHVMEEEVDYYTPPEIAKQLRVSAEKVHGWIRRGELRAINVGNGSRPLYRISHEHLENFLRRREVQPPPQTIRRPRRPPGVPSYF